MPTPAEFAQAGPWAVVVFLLAGGIVGLWTAVVKEWIVPGSRLHREEQKSRRLEVQVRRNTKSLETIAKRLAEKPLDV
jgi:hypothetical protein